ncbi:Metallo-dependent phosphatase-like protein [Cristinia sonorae]|uniref:Metallo-dependent phosphatase-like protein n=1 Tax=Cristinia sonorae TaxID=1940300 RepID=A0A8K0XN71_9AGAR|nr:Metallo-dependent phosphatase-like protein [Cristinia sonorae]
MATSTAPSSSTLSAEQTLVTPATTANTAVVHREYDINNPPPHPGPEWTRFVCISDTHSRVFPVPPGDVLLHSGDLTNVGTYGDFEITVRWIESMPHSKKMSVSFSFLLLKGCDSRDATLSTAIIAGNHDITLHQEGGWYNSNFHRWHRMGKEDIRAIRKLLLGNRAKEAGLVYLEDQKYEFQAKEGGRTWSVYGSPWSPWFYDWAFNYRRGEDAEKRVAAYEKTDILLTHGPPHKILDKTTRGDDAGCEALMARLPSLRPRLHVFGHIHEDHGAVIYDWSSHATAVTLNNTVATATSSQEHTVFVNAANWPAGRRAYAASLSKCPFGSGPFVPVIVDLLDDVSPAEQSDAAQEADRDTGTGVV